MYGKTRGTLLLPASHNQHDCLHDNGLKTMRLRSEAPILAVISAINGSATM